MENEELKVYHSSCYNLFVKKSFMPNDFFCARALKNIKKVFFSTKNHMSCNFFASHYTYSMKAKSE